EPLAALIDLLARDVPEKAFDLALRLGSQGGSMTRRRATQYLTSGRSRSYVVRRLVDWLEGAGLTSEAPAALIRPEVSALLREAARVRLYERVLVDASLRKELDLREYLNGQDAHLALASAASQTPGFVREFLTDPVIDAALKLSCLDRISAQPDILE